MYRTSPTSSRVQDSASVGFSSPVSIEQLQTIWGNLNAVYFHNRLPPIEIQWSTRLTSSVGLFVSQTGPRDRRVSPLERHGAGRVIRLSLPLLSEKPHAEIRDTLAHEMIHQWQFDVQKRCPNHGQDFRRMMSIMNRDGLEITIYHTLTQEVEALTRYLWQCVHCGRAYPRQRRTISPKHHRCGDCMGSLQEVSPQSVPSSQVQKRSSRQPAEGREREFPEWVRPQQLAFDFYMVEGPG